MAESAFLIKSLSVALYTQNFNPSLERQEHINLLYKTRMKFCYDFFCLDYSLEVAIRISALLIELLNGS